LKPARAKAPERRIDIASRLRRQLEGALAPYYHLRLYIAGSSSNSFFAMQSVQQLCQDILGGKRCKLEVIDLYQQPKLAQRDGVVAIPSLVKLEPKPMRTFIGDMRDLKKLVAGLGIRLQKNGNGTKQK
jgi:circadian clock protein KaiB